MSEPTKEELFAAMPHVRVGNDDGTEMHYRCIEGVWRWKHMRGDEVLNEGVGAP